MPFLIFAIVLFFLIFSLINYYMGSRIYRYLRVIFPALSRRKYWMVYTPLVLFLFAGRFLPGGFHPALQWISSYWLAAFMYILLALVVLDGLRFLYRHIMQKKFRVPSKMAVRSIGLILILLLIGLMVYGTYNAREIRVTSYTVNVDKALGTEDELKLVFLSDLHLGYIVDHVYLERLVEEINTLTPDMVLIGGDIIDDDLTPFIEQNMAQALAKIEARYGVYAVLGNHDGTFAQQSEVIRQFEQGGIQVLVDQAVNIENMFYVVGRTDDGMPRGGPQKTPLEQILRGLDRSMPILLMDHNPSDLSEAQAQGIDLQLSGHTHGGQLFPFTLGTGLIFEQDWGYLQKDILQLIVSSGAGTWGPPLRIGTRSEIVEINLQFQK